jgi:L-lactate dehydrogenase complex protein LldG
VAGSRDAILRAVRAAAGLPLGAPHRTEGWVTYGDPSATFVARLAEAGGTALRIEPGADLATAIRGLPAFAGARRLLSRVEGVPSLEVGDGPRAPHDLAGYDGAVLPGVVGVAENGAVWWSPGDALERAAAYLAEHVAIVLPADALVHNLHEAYARVEPAACGFGCFVCGPSKTADIEQALVIGAHGPRSLTVVLTGAAVRS